MAATAEFHGSHPQHPIAPCNPEVPTACDVCGGVLSAAPAAAVEHAHFPFATSYRCCDADCHFWICAKCRMVPEVPLEGKKVYCVLSDARYEVVRTRPRESATAVGTLSRDTVHVVVSSTTSQDGDLWLRFEGGGWILAAAVSQLEADELPNCFGETDGATSANATLLHRSSAAAADVADGASPWKLMLCAAEALFEAHQVVARGEGIEPRHAMALADLACAVLQECADASAAAKCFAKRGEFLECGMPDDAAVARAVADSLALWDLAGQFVDLAKQRGFVAPCVVQCLPLVVSVLDAAAVRDAVSAQSAAVAMVNGLASDTAILPAVDKFLRPASLQFVRLLRAVSLTLGWVAHVPRSDESVRDVLIVATKLLCGGSFFSDDDSISLAFFTALEAVLSRCTPTALQGAQRLVVNADVLEIVVRTLNRTSNVALAERCVSLLQQIWHRQPDIWARHSRMLRSPLAANVNKWSTNLTVASPSSSMLASALRAVSTIVADPSWPEVHLVEIGSQYAVLCDDCCNTAVGARVLLSRPSPSLRCSNVRCASTAAVEALHDGDNSREAKLSHCLDNMLSLSDIDACAALALSDAATCFTPRIVSRVIFKSIQHTIADLLTSTPSIALLLIQATVVSRTTIEAACGQFAHGTLIADLRAALQSLDLESAVLETRPETPPGCTASAHQQNGDSDGSLMFDGSAQRSAGLSQRQLANTSGLWDYAPVEGLASAVRALQLTDL